MPPYSDAALVQMNFSLRPLEQAVGQRGLDCRFLTLFTSGATAGMRFTPGRCEGNSGGTCIRLSERLDLLQVSLLPYSRA